MYHWRRLAIDSLQEALELFEETHTFELDEETLDLIWDVTIRIPNKKVTRKFGTYWGGKKRIEIYPAVFRDNPLKFVDTVRHELAHHIAYIIHGENQHHNENWQYICGIVGAEATHISCLIEWGDKLDTHGIERFESYKLNSDIYGHATKSHPIG